MPSLCVRDVARVDGTITQPVLAQGGGRNAAPTIGSGERRTDKIEWWILHKSKLVWDFGGPYVPVIRIFTNFKWIIIRHFAIQRRLMWLDNRFPSPPPRRSWIFTMGKLLHVVLVATCHPLINHCITIQSQKTRVTSPHKSRRMFRPSLCDSCECSPQLIRFHPLFPKAKSIKSFRTFNDWAGCDKGVDHFCWIWKRLVNLPMTTQIFLSVH